MENKELATKIYLLILVEINNYTDEQMKNLTQEEINCDPLFQKLQKLVKEENGKYI